MIQTIKTRNGFTLIEMSIVLVIIGLLTGSIFVGKTLIRQSQVNSASTDEQRYIQATLSFQQKYGALPGDFAGATALWGIASGTTGNDVNCEDGYSPVAPAPATCNGNGDGQIYNPVYSGSNNLQNVNETHRYWQHLYNAQLITGNYNGISTNYQTQENDIGINVPESKVAGGGFGIMYAGIVNSATSTGDTTDFPNGTYGHVYVFGAQLTGYLPAAPLLTTTEASGVDTKFDDGSPITGNIVTWNTGATAGYAVGCAYLNTTLSPNVMQYNTSATGPQCSLVMVTGF